MGIPTITLQNEINALSRQVRLLRQQICCSSGTGGGIQSIVAGENITIDDTDPENPIISASTDSVPTLYSADGSIGTVTRTVTLPSASTLLFDSPTQATFEVNLQNLTPAAVVLFRVRNGGGDGGVILQKGATESLLMGQYGSKLRIGDVQLNNVLSAPSLATDVNGNIIAGSTPITSTPNLLIAATNASGNVIDGSANVITRPLTGFVTVNASIVATDTILQGLQKAQGQINQRIGLTSILTGFATGANSTVLATDTLLAGLGKLQGQINARAPLASPALTGTPTAPTAALSTNTTQLATTAFVQQELTDKALLKADFRGGQSPFTADGTTTVFNITHNLGAVPSYFTLTTTEPISSEHLTRTITFPDVNTMRLTFNSAPLVGANANYVWIVYK